MTGDHPTWADWAFVLHNSHDPLEDVTGHFTNGPGGLLTFHPWDISGEAHEERRASGPGVMPSQHEFDMARLRETGARHAADLEERLVAALLTGSESRT